jgi:transcriptional regulator with XRE-family HTH domain
VASDTSTETDRRFAANFKAARERAKLSGREVAEQMRERGIPWHQQTVVRLESGEQRVRLGEAEALAGIVGSSVDALMRPADLDMAARDILSSAAKVRDSRRKLTDATARFDTDVAWLRRLLDKAREKGIAERLPNEMRAGISALGERRERPGVPGADAPPQSGQSPADNDN